ncbi:MAG: sterol desaturase family protein [Pseudobdellovibrio sp.]
MSALIYITILLSTFIVMEFTAWFLHKYVMHGFLWNLHYDHHNPPKDRAYQLNDFFALFFAVPSFLFILFDSIYKIPTLGAIGFGIMAYGAAYFFIHEVIIHRRWKIFKVKNNWYFRGVNSAHKIHHMNPKKEDGCNFGMLVVPIKYFKKR